MSTGNPAESTSGTRGKAVLGLIVIAVLAAMWMRALWLVPVIAVLAVEQIMRDREQAQRELERMKRARERPRQGGGRDSQ